MKLREYKIDDNLLFFKIDMEVGYGGVLGCFKWFEFIVFEYVFVLYFVGVLF